MPLRFAFPTLVLAASFHLTLSAQTSIPQPEQQPTPSTSAEQPGYTLHTGVRIVLADVTVMDKNGHLVHGLPASAFHVTIDKDPRPLLSFEEHNLAQTEMAATPVTGANTFSNEFLEHLPPVLNIAVIDISRMGITAQMQLAIQFRHFLEQLPPDKPLAIYARVGEHMVSFQNFTSDHALLQAAADKIMPWLPQPHDYFSDLNLMYEFAQQLAQIPGHKNVLWFNNGTGLLDASDPGVSRFSDQLRDIYDQLEASRISLYPIDTRGAIFGAAQEHMQMDDYAQNTGGHAIYNHNYIDQVAHEVLKQDSSFYTLTVSPKDFKPDNKWHKVNISVEPSGYSLSYRRGYFADGRNLGPPADNKSDHHRTLLLTTGKTLDVPADVRSAPIIFEASVLPSTAPAPPSDKPFTPLSALHPAQKGMQAYLIRYSLPPDIFVTKTIEGQQHATFDIAALSFDKNGEKIGAQGSHVDLVLPQNDPHIALRFMQQIDLKKGDNYLYLAVWDTVTGCLGTLQIPITAK